MVEHGRYSFNLPFNAECMLPARSRNIHQRRLFSRPGEQRQQPCSPWLRWVAEEEAAESKE